MRKVELLPTRDCEAGYIFQGGGGADRGDSNGVAQYIGQTVCLDIKFITR